MAKITRGKFKGMDVAILQFCNDWFMVEDKEKTLKLLTRPISPTSLIFDINEFWRINKARNLGQTGMMFLRFMWKSESAENTEFRLIKR